MSDLKAQVLEKLAKVECEIDHDAYDKEDLELLDRELSGKISEIFKTFNENAKKAGYDTCGADGFIDEVRNQLLRP